MEVDYLSKIEDLENELQKKEREIFGYLDRIEYLENSIIKLEKAFDEAQNDSINPNAKEKLMIAQLNMTIEDQEREIRELKDKMGFLRKEKISLQQKIQKIEEDQEKKQREYAGKLTKSSPLDVLVSELQDKIHKQKLKINKLESQVMSQAQYNDMLARKDKTIESLEKEIDKINDFVVDLKGSQEDANKSLLILLEKKEIEIEDWKRKADEQVLNKEIESFEKRLEEKDKEIHELNDYIISLKGTEEDRSENLLIMLERKEQEIEKLKNFKMPDRLMEKNKQLESKLHETETMLNELKMNRILINNQQAVANVSELENRIKQLENINNLLSEQNLKLKVKRESFKS